MQLLCCCDMIDVSIWIELLKKKHIQQRITWRMRDWIIIKIKCKQQNAMNNREMPTENDSSGYERFNRQTWIYEAENALKMSALLLLLFFRTLIGFANTKWAIVVFMTSFDILQQQKKIALTNPRIITRNLKKILRKKYPLNNYNYAEE